MFNFGNFCFFLKINLNLPKQVGDHLTLSITGICNITETKNDIFIQITEASSHSMKFASLIQTSEESEKQKLDSLLRGSLSRLIIRDFYNGAPPVKPYKQQACCCFFFQVIKIIYGKYSSHIQPDPLLYYKMIILRYHEIFSG